MLLSLKEFVAPSSSTTLYFIDDATLIKVFERTLGKARKSMGLFPLLFKHTRYKISLQEKYIFKAVRLF
jgi:hypothetical protein